jgi:NAD-dependent deacetylase
MSALNRKMAEPNLIDPELKTRLMRFVDSEKLLIVMTGAGVSAESGIPTFRGPKDYWTVGSRVYQPQEISTNSMLVRQPEAVWMWFLYRRGICRMAQPNPGHFAIVELERRLGDRFILITQNVDGLHTRAGNSLARTYKIHGDLEFMRCIKECTREVYPIPEAIPAKDRHGQISSEEWDLLKCPRCGAISRPHVLLWDEYYNEEHYRFNSSLEAADRAAVLIVVGTTGATNLPNRIVDRFLRHKGLMIDINIEMDVFAHSAINKGGYFIQSGSASALPQIVETLRS